MEEYVWHENVDEINDTAHHNVSLTQHACK